MKLYKKVLDKCVGKCPDCVNKTVEDDNRRNDIRRADWCKNKDREIRCYPNPFPDWCPLEELVGQE